MDFKEIKQLIELFEESALAEIEVEEEGRRIRLSRHGEAPPAYHYMAPPQAQPAAPDAASSGESGAAAPADENGLEEGQESIDSPMVGTFYASPAPGEAPFVLPGDRVDADSPVCIIEAMKIMNEVVAKKSAVVEKVLVENGEPVEFGQPLFAIRPL